MTALAAPETGVQTAPEPALNPRDFPDYNAYLDAKYPNSVGITPPVYVGQAGQAAYEASAQKAAAEVAAAQARNAAEAAGDRLRRAEWEAAAKERTRQLHEAQRIPSDSAGLAAGEVAGPAETTAEEAE